MKYLDLISQGAEETAKSNNALVAEEASLATQSAILNCKREISQAAQSVIANKQAVPFNVGNIVNAINTLQLLERKLNVLNELHKELF